MARRQPQGRTPFGRKERQADFPDLSKKPFSRGNKPSLQLDPVVGGRGRRFRARKPNPSEQGVIHNRRVPANPHDPKSKDPFMRSGMAMGTNDTKIFGRAGMSMDAKKMRKMFG